ncbi:hypothetical protein GCK32_017960 [Trichostrongylus colubriformis]|uniref:Uncharacterized protein n=1 Tax=Trichostrongylus colubriformis TaxID=6319 RepID=A0AAN8I963_TRICO
MALGGTCIQRACCTTPFFGHTTTTAAPEVDGEATRTTNEFRTPAPTVEGSIERKVDLLEIEELLKLVENLRSTIGPPPDEVQSFKKALQLCLSGQRSDGVCATDDDCPSSHRCEEERCCYVT